MSPPAGEYYVIGGRPPDAPPSTAHAHAAKHSATAHPASGFGPPPHDSPPEAVTWGLTLVLFGESSRLSIDRRGRQPTCPDVRGRGGTSEAGGGPVAAAQSRAAWVPARAHAVPPARAGDCARSFLRRAWSGAGGDAERSGAGAAASRVAVPPGPSAAAPAAAPLQGKCRPPAPEPRCQVLNKR